MSEDGETSEVIGWLNQSAMALSQGGERARRSESNALRRSLADVRVVGFADPTHGTQEFYQSRHRYLQLLVQELGFQALAIEGSYAAATLINRYVADGEGDPESAAQTLGVAMWNVCEFIATLEWLRDWNRRLHPDQKVQVFGLDVWPTAESRRAVLEYLRVFAPSWYAPAATVLEQVASGERLGFINAWTVVTQEQYLQVRALLTWFEEGAEELMDRTPPSRYEEAIQHVRVILCWLSVNLSSSDRVDISPDLPRMSGFNPFARSRYMAENLLYLMDRRIPGGKIVVWAHMFHLGVGAQDPQLGSLTNMGSILRGRWRHQYYVFGFECGGGAYLARELLAGNALGQLRRVPIPRAPAHSLPWYLGQASAPAFVVELRGHNTSSAVDTWVNTPRLAHAMGWLCGNPPHLYRPLRLEGFYDALIFFRDTHTTTPIQRLGSASGDTRPSGPPS
jgi:erythromycin esterase